MRRPAGFPTGPLQERLITRTLDRQSSCAPSMGSSTSKTAASATRRFPARDLSQYDSPTPTCFKQRGGRTRDDVTNEDRQELDFAPGDFSRRLRDMGIAKLNTMDYSPSSNVSVRSFPSSQYNATLSVLEARETLQQLANDDVLGSGRSERDVKRFADMRMAIDALRMRDMGWSDGVIEQRLNLEPGSIRIISHIAQNY